MIALSSHVPSAADSAQNGPGTPTPHKDKEFTEFFRRSSGWTAGDGALSVALSDGRVLWLFGDSHLDDIDPKTGTMPCLFQARNAGLMQQISDPGNVRTLLGEGPVFHSWLKNSEDGAKEWFWPLCGFQNEHTLWIYLSALRKTEAGGPFGFESIGHDYWAKIHLPEFEPKTYVALPDFNGITFGNGLIVEGRYVYAFGGKQRGLASDVYVARFNPRRPESDWVFWDGKSWSPNVKKAAAIAYGRSNSIHVCKIKESFLLTTTEFSVGCDQGKQIFMAKSQKPTGPFGPLKSIFTIDDSYQGHLPFFYFAVAHPEFINAAGELLVTYSINNYEPCVTNCVNGRAIPDHYRPKAIRVPLKAIDVAW